MLKVHDLGKRYTLKPKGNGSAQNWDLWALRHATFELQPGQILGIVGPNGAGKTTLLKILSRVAAPTEGWARGRGRVVPLLEAGAFFQREMTGRENIYLSAAVHGFSRAYIHNRLEEIVEFADLTKFIDSPVRCYSSGMFLRLAFSIAINLKPDILLADEILAVGDIRFQELCMERVSRAGQEGMCVLFVSHDLNAVRRLCAQTLWLNQGQTVKLGPTEEVLKDYQEKALEWKSEKQGAENEFGGFISANLASADGSPIGLARASEDILVHFRFRTHLPQITLEGVMDVQTAGVLAFRSPLPYRRLLPEPGEYSGFVRIPANLLSETSYSVGLKLGLINGQGENRRIILPNAVAFKVYDVAPENSARAEYQGRLDGVISPKLDWTIQQANRPDSLGLIAK